MSKPNYINHPLHIILVVLTGGLWLLVYIPILLKHSAEMRRQQQRR